MDPIACSLVNPRYDEQEQEMTHNTFDQFNALVTRLAAADGTVADERAHDIPDTALSHEVLAAIVGGFRLKIGGAEAAGFFKEATGFDSESEVTE
jgi:hypothetical protein